MNWYYLALFVFPKYLSRIKPHLIEPNIIELLQCLVDLIFIDLETDYPINLIFKLKSLNL